LTAVALDPADEARLYVGTAEGTLLVSDDGGATFDERVITTRTVVERSVGLASIVDAVAAPPGQLGTRTREYTLRIDPPFASRPSTRPGFQYDTLFFSLRPDFVRAETTPSTSVNVPQLLRTAVSSRERSAEPIVHVMVCVGAALPLVVLTRRSVVASDDQGESYLEVLATASSRFVSGRCLRRGSATRIVIGTTDGSFESSDGVTFAPIASTNGSRAVSALSLCADGTLHLASGRRTYQQRRDDADLSPLYDDDDPSIPITNVTALSCGDDGTLAIGSDDGLRVWRDGRLSVAAPETLEGLRIRDLAWVGPRLYAVLASCPMGIRTTRCLETRLVVSDDRGESWSDSGEPARRRSFLGVLEAAGRGEALVLTSGGLWSSGPLRSGPSGSRDDGFSDELSRWAMRHLAATPPLDDVIEHVLARLALDESNIDRVSQMPVTRHFVPLLEASLSVTATQRSRDRSSLPSSAVGEENRDTLGVTVGVQASWNWGFDLPNAYTLPEPSAGDRIALQELRRQIAYAVEDSWRERVRLLERLRSGVSDPLRALVTAERVAVLGAMLESYLDGPLGLIEPGAYEAL
jgi:photosystem II stability/assembly factor-like uncharacterized protein